MTRKCLSELLLSRILKMKIMMGIVFFITAFFSVAGYENQTGSMEAFAQSGAPLGESLDLGEAIYFIDYAAPMTLTKFNASNEIEIIRVDSLNKWGDVFLEQKRSKDAYDRYKEAYELLNEIVKRTPDNIVWKRGLSISHISMGNALFQQGEDDKALEEYESALKINEDLANVDLTPIPDGTWGFWSSDRNKDINVAGLYTTFSYEKMGDVFLENGDFDEAFKKYEKARDIRKDYADYNPDNVQWKSILSTSHLKAGVALWAQNKNAEALGEYQAALAISKELVNNDQDNVKWKRQHDEVASAIARLDNLTE